MIEGRALISSTEEFRRKIEESGAKFDSEYDFKDIIFVPKKKHYNLDNDFLRARVYIKNNWPTKKVVLVRKQTKIKRIGKVDTLILKEEFNTEKEALDFVQQHLSNEFEYGFEYERAGWQYNFEKSRIFVEDIKGYSPSVEIEANSEEQLNKLFNKFGINERISSSLPEIMRKILNIK